MRKLIKYLSYVLVLIGSFFVLCSGGYAKTFSKEGIELYIDDMGSYRKYDDDRNNAYCSEQKLGFFGSCIGTSDKNSNEGCQSNQVNYTFDTIYDTAKNCAYRSEDGMRYDGDCSSIVGYIIHEAESDGRYDANTRWFKAQLAVWMYLGRFSYGDLITQNAEITAGTRYDTYARDYVEEAWKQYASVHNVVLDNNRDDVNFSLNYSDTNFYYQPSTSSCDVGFYRTKSFQVINNENVDINVLLQTTSSDVDICYIKRNGVTECGASKNVVILPRQGVEVFLKSNVDSRENIKFTTVATYYSNDRDNRSIYDSEHWLPPILKVNGKDVQGQGMLVLKEGSSGIDYQVKHSSSKSVTFYKDKITRIDCDDDSNKGNGSKTSPVNKVCADKSDSKKDYTANFSGCTCFGLDLGNNRYVSIVVTEEAGFSFGKLTPSGTLYAGGGFGFSENGIITQYVAKVKWEYANLKNGIPYYYNGNNLKDNDARSIENEINETLKKKIKDKLSLNFKTRDSNDYLNKSLVDVPLELDVSNVQFSNRVYELNSNAMKMNEAYFSSDGRVSYNGKNNTYSIKGGNKYYVPMGYSESVFPFDIVSSNLSIVEGINFWYEAECDKDVQDLYKSLYYRSIDLDNPFPKANNLTANVPENWRFWYCGTSTICNNVNNRKRLEDTYQNYPNGPLYEIVLNSDKFKKINAMTDYYTSWSNVNKDGVSSFVTDMDLFEAYANDKSYCPIGRFNKDCDDK